MPESSRVDLPGDQDGELDASTATASSGTTSNRDSGAGASMRRVRDRLSADLFRPVSNEDRTTAPPRVPISTPESSPPADQLVTTELVDEPLPRRTGSQFPFKPDNPLVSPKPVSKKELTTKGLDLTADTPEIDSVRVPAAKAPRTAGGGLVARRVHRIVRRVDPWSVLKLSLLFFFCVWLMVLIAGVLIWGVAVTSGSVANVESFIAKLLNFEEFHFNGDQILRLFAMGGLIMVFLATAVTAILSVLFNLISDLVGGVRITVIEEETSRRVAKRP